MADKPHVPDPDAPPSEEELAAANKLRDELERPAPAKVGADSDAELAQALSSAWSPRPLGPDDHSALLDRALAGHAERRRRARVVVRVSFGAGALAVLAAGFALAVGDLSRSPESASAVRVERTEPTAGAALVSTRSTQPLFSEPFARAGGETARVDRIAMARAADLRENEFARWGVR
jgi:hypothetical protein